MTAPLRLIASIAIAGTVAESAPPAARVVPYVQTFYGTARSDPYHWMEAGGPALTTFLERQTAYTEAVVRQNPGRARVRAAVAAAYASTGAATSTEGVTRVGSRVLYLQNLPGDAAPSLLARADGATSSSVVVPARRLPKHAVIGWFAPSPNGTKIAYGATSPSEFVVVHVCDADGSHDDAQAIEPSVIPFAVWHGERAFYYPTVRASATDRTDLSYLHVLGARYGSDVLVGGFGANGPLGSRTSRHLFTNYSVLGDTVIAAVNVETTPYVTVYAAPFARATRPNGPWRELFTLDDRIVAVAVAGRAAYALTDRGSARRRFVIRDLATGRTLRTIAPGVGYRSNVFANRTGVYVSERIGASARLMRFDAAGDARGAVALPTANALPSIDGDPAASSFAVQTASFDRPSTWYDVAGPHATVTRMSENAPVPPLFDGLRHVDAFATSADGTHVPYTVVYEAATPRDGRRPTIVVGYGAYGYDIEPPVPPEDLALVRLGVVLVVAHVRGGGEFGEPWHLAGKGPTKQHTIDDFVACARAVVTTGWTSHAKLAGEGGSAGGITIGGAVTQHPALFAVALSDVGFSDMVDLENMPNGPGNVPEFGSVKTRDGFRELLAMSAYDHVGRAAYPATMLTTGLNDQRTAPWQAAKMAARLRASTTSGRPVLLRADAQGHGVVLDAADQIEEYADEFTFMLWQLGEPGFAMPRRAFSSPA